MAATQDLDPTSRWTTRLDDSDPARRREALTHLARQAASGDISLPSLGREVNVHMHTFFSYNAAGYSPAHFAWLARQAGLAVAGIVDFDVLDGLDEFLSAGRLLGLRTVVGIETRVFVPEFMTRIINSPGEPGIAYHMGTGFTCCPADEQARFLAGLRTTAQQRNRDMLARVNAITAPLTLVMDRDVLPLTPNGNATERHLCLAYARRAAQHFTTPEELREYWIGILGPEAAGLEVPDGPALQALLRAKTMKRGGAGYVQPAPETFPTLADMNRFVRSQGALPTLTWLDGSSAGEQALDEWLDLCVEQGVAAVNIIPDRNYTPGVRDARLAALQRMVDAARQRALPLLAGTEMNSPGQKFVDAFDSAELAPFRPDFLQGAYLLYGHSLLQAAAGMGYVSDWARSTFPERVERNAFFARLGEQADPRREPASLKVHAAMAPAEILQSMRQR